MKKVKYIAPFVLTTVMLGACSNDEKQTSSDTDALVEQYVKYSDDDFYSEWQSSSLQKLI